MPEQPMPDINVDELRLHGLVPLPGPSKPPRHKRGEKFILGPIPLPWIAQATRLRGSAVPVGLMLWHKRGMTKNRTVPYCHNHAAEVGVAYQASHRAIEALEKAKLIAVVRPDGRGLKVTILDTPPCPADQQLAH